MNLKTELLVRSLIAIFLLFFVGKLVGPLLLQYFYDRFFGGKKKKKNIDMDLLIANKEQMLRGDSPKKTLMGKESSKKSKKQTEVAYLEASKQSGQYAKVLELFDCAKWGEGKAYQELKTKFTRNFGFSIELLPISKATNFFIKKDLSLSLNRDQLPDFDQIADALQTKIALDILLEESKQNQGKVLDRLAKKYKVQPSSIRLAFETIILETEGEKKSLLYEKLYNKRNNSQLTKLEMRDWEKICIKLILGPTRERFTSKQTLFSRLSKEALIYESLTPLPKLNPKKDFEKAYQILNISKSDDETNIKKAYKKLAVAKHPDKLASAKLPKSLEKVLHENFATIQTAYDMISKSRSK